MALTYRNYLSGDEVSGEESDTERDGDVDILVTMNVRGRGSENGHERFGLVCHNRLVGIPQRLQNNNKQRSTSRYGERQEVNALI